MNLFNVNNVLDTNIFDNISFLWSNKTVFNSNSWNEAWPMLINRIVTLGRIRDMTSGVFHSSLDTSLSFLQTCPETDWSLHEDKTGSISVGWHTTSVSQHNDDHVVSLASWILDLEFILKTLSSAFLLFSFFLYFITLFFHFYVLLPSLFVLKVILFCLLFIWFHSVLRSFFLSFTSFILFFY